MLATSLLEHVLMWARQAGRRAGGQAADSGRQAGRQTGRLLLYVSSQA